MNQKRFVILVKNLIFLLFFVALIGIVNATTYNCSNCSDCNSVIDSASSGDIIQLNESIMNNVGDCIYLGYKDNITFDCQGNTIDGDDVGFEYGIWLNYNNNSDIKNCNITDFEFVAFGQNPCK